MEHADAAALPVLLSDTDGDTEAQAVATTLLDALEDDVCVRELLGECDAECDRGTVKDPRVLAEVDGDGVTEIVARGDALELTDDVSEIEDHTVADTLTDAVPEMDVFTLTVGDRDDRDEALADTEALCDFETSGLEETEAELFTERLGVTLRDADGDAVFDVEITVDLEEDVEIRGDRVGSVDVECDTETTGVTETMKTVADGDVEVEALAESDGNADTDNVALSHAVSVREPLGEEDPVGDDEADCVFAANDRDFIGDMEIEFDDDEECVTEADAVSVGVARVDGVVEGEKEPEPEWDVERDAAGVPDAVTEAIEDRVADVDMLIVRVAMRETVESADTDAEFVVDTLPVAKRELAAVRERLALPEAERLRNGLTLDLKLADTLLLSDGERDIKLDTVALEQTEVLRDAEGVAVVDLGGEIDRDGEPEFVGLGSRENEPVGSGVSVEDTALTVRVGELDVRNDIDATGDFVSDREFVPVIDVAGEPDGEPDTDALGLSRRDADGEADCELEVVGECEMESSADTDVDAERLP